MEWIKLGNTTIPICRMLWMDYDKNWFPGRFVVDSDYGECVSVDNTEGEYVPIGMITHYMQIDKPQ